MSVPLRGLAISDLLVAGGSPESVDAFLERHDFPVRERLHTTFVYRGAADSVLLGHWLFGIASALEMERVPGTDLWYLTMDLPTDSRVEYRFQRVRGTEAEWILDPLNPHTVRGPFGRQSVCHADGYVRPEWTRPDPAARRGELRPFRVRSRAFGERTITVYLPGGFRKERRHRLAIVLDGSDYLRFTDFHTILDNLIHRREVPPLIAAFVAPEKRIREFTDNPDHAAFLVEELAPQLERAFPLATGASDRVLVGAGLGAVAALTAAGRHPGFFGKLLLQSGSFAFTDVGPTSRTALLDPVVEFVNAYREAPRRVANRVFLSCGLYEPLIYENRAIVPLLRRSGMEVHYVEVPDGHNWENWRDRLREGLAWLLPDPTWLYYR